MTSLPVCVTSLRIIRTTTTTTMLPLLPKEQRMLMHATAYSYPFVFQYEPIPSLRSVPLSLRYNRSNIPCIHQTDTEYTRNTTRDIHHTDTEYNRSPTPRVSIVISTNSFGYYNISILKDKKRLLFVNKQGRLLILVNTAGIVYVS